ncbi:uncharacterized protein LOC115455616 [Manduca sexta]|uniref:uncharacterized protein LOC115455616 n=1 Tax=Manduca sexta TaxID=7130 RepID=UPI00188E6688|nr:uncharacterized protein LOC115455616 [Manduca sexta]
MEEMGYIDADDRKNASSQWQLGATSSLSIDSVSSRQMNQHLSHHLHLYQKREILSQRRNIPTSMHERLSYYRTYVSSPNKTQIICMQHVEFNRFLWYYIFNVFFKSLPHSFVYIFLASYAADEHLFLSKMVPIMQGCKFTFLVAGFFDLVGFIDTAILLLDYVVCGLLYKNPWNRCKAASYFNIHRNVTMYCYNMYDFAKKFENGTAHFQAFAYIDENEEVFQVAQVEYYRHRIRIWATPLSLFYFGVIWVLAAMMHRQVYKKCFWKILNTLQWVVNTVDLISFVHLTLAYFQERLEDIPATPMPVDDLTNTLWKADIDLLAESTTAPPLVHILTARSTQEIEPSRDSAIMITSNAICFIFRGLLTYRIKRYIESQVKAPIYQTDFNQHSWFYFWPMYFYTLSLGDLYTIAFFSFNLIMEFLSITVTFFCLVETIVCEWKWARRWLVTMALTATAAVVMSTTSLHNRLLYYIYSKLIATLAEVLILYCMYPLGRLVDDVTFHYGIPPTRLRILSLSFVPIFYTIKCYTMMDALIEVIVKAKFVDKDKSYKWTWSLMLVPIVLGIFYTIYVYIFKLKKHWQQIFCPHPSWGPKDYSARQLRKQYDSRVYTGSQASRVLGRYLTTKAEPKAYKLDLRYDNRRRSMVVNTADVRFEYEKKWM